MYINVGLIGFPLSHSMSSALHSYFFHLSGLNGGYCCFEIPSSSEIKSVIDIFKKYSFAGFNITVPYKTDIMDYCEEIDKEALESGAVNTVSLKNDLIKGYNTDIFGFAKLLEYAGVHTEDKQVLLLGSGGAARAVIGYLNKARPGFLTIANRTLEKALSLASSCNFNVRPQEGFAGLRGKGYDIIINSTSLGLRGEPFPDMGVECFEAAIDLQYKSGITPFLSSIGGNVKKVGGFPMLVWQAAEAFKIWTGAEIKPNVALLASKIGLEFL